MSEKQKVAVVGCGPAGLSAAIALHDVGVEVELIERFDEARPVGSGLMLQPTGLAILDAMGLRPQAELLGQRIDGMLGRIAPNGKVVLDIRYQVLSDNMYGVAIHRASLFQTLFDAVKQRAIPVRCSSQVSALVYQADKVCLLLDENKLLSQPFDWIVDASGGQSPLLKYAQKQLVRRKLDYGALWATVNFDESHFDKTLLEQRYKSGKIMVGVLPCGSMPHSAEKVATFFWSLRNDEYRHIVNEGIATFKEKILPVWPSVEPLLNQLDGFEQLAHASYSHHTLPRPYGDRIVYIGDAAHSTSPQLGQGANMALLDAWALAKSVEVSVDTPQFMAADAFKLYANTRRLHVRVFQVASFALTPFYQSDNVVMPWLRDTFFEPVSKLPFFGSMVTSLGAGLLCKPNDRIAKILPQSAGAEFL